MSDVIRLEYRGVTMRFTDAAGKSLTAVQNVSLAVRDGEVVGVLQTRDALALVLENRRAAVGEARAQEPGVGAALRQTGG